MARAVQHAPVLERFLVRIGAGNMKLNPKCLKNSKELDLRQSFELEYYAAGVHEDDDDMMFNKARVIWKAGDWRPDEEVQRHWRDAVGPDGLLIFEGVDEAFGRGGGGNGQRGGRRLR
ncbi:hypothetical protein IMZ48_12420 [Candidatus Bathyarchaeota archaeon]|nr:hypothetical protein [Candidatus Bathyarchaeota archaeon]